MLGTLFAIAVVMHGPLSQPATRSPVRVIRAMGLGHPPPWMSGGQARLMARRAAEVRAVRNLAVKLGFGRRARVRGFRYAATIYRPDGSVEVVVEQPVRTVPTYVGMKDRPSSLQPSSLILHPSAVGLGFAHHVVSAQFSVVSQLFRVVNPSVAAPGLDGRPYRQSLSGSRRCRLHRTYR